MSNSVKQIAIVNQQSSFNTPNGREALDLALIFAAFDQSVCAIFIDDGVYQLYQGQQAELIKTKDYLATMKAFDLYDIDKILVCEQSLQRRGINACELTINANVATSAQIRAQLERCDHVLSL